MLKAKNLHKSYRKKEVVRGVNIEVEPGQVVGLLGPNGAGKTTCFYMIVGLIPTDKGNITVDDVDITHKPVNIRSSLGVGYLPQEASIFRKLSRLSSAIRPPMYLVAKLTLRRLSGRHQQFSGPHPMSP